MGKYWQILKRYKVGLLISPLLVLITVLCETVQPMFMAEIIDNGVMPRDLSVITRQYCEYLHFLPHRNRLRYRSTGNTFQ